MTIEESIRMISEKDQEIHAFLEVFDTSNQPKKDGLLTGKPIAIKDSFVYNYGKSTGASKILESFSAPYTATAVQKIIDAGGTIVGKTNLDEFTMGSSTENSAFGTTKNPLDLTRVPGGSSGGSAAAVAAGMVWGALGSDTGGSIRQPAAFCGVVGFKPTYGTVSRYGAMAMASSLDVVGPLAKTVEDTELFYDAINGADPNDATSRNPNPKSKYETVNVSTMTIGIPKEFFSTGLDPRIKDGIDKIVEKMKASGTKFIDISLPSLRFALAVYYLIVPVEVASNMARYDGVRYGLSAKDAKSLLDVYIESRTKGFGSEVKRRILLGTYASSAGYVDQYYKKAQDVRQMIKEEFVSALESVDAIFTPVTPSLPFVFGKNTSDPLQMYLEDIYTVPINLVGLPALSMPIDWTNKSGKRLPIAMQIIGKELDDYKVFKIGKAIERL